MKSFLAIAFLLGLTALIAAATYRPPMLDALSSAGCRSAVVQARQPPTREILAITTYDCLGIDGAPLAAAAALNRLAATAWATPTQPFERLDLTVYRTDDNSLDANTVTASYTRADLAARYGERSSDLDQPDYRTVILDAGMIILMPLGVIAPAAAAIFVGIRSARTGALIIRIR